MPWDPFFPVTATLLAIAGASDAARHRIPNALPVAIAAISLAARATHGGLPGALSALAALALTAASLFVLWSRGRIGGGDLKLAAAAAAWVGVSGLPRFVLASAISAGVLGVLCYLASAPAARREMRTHLLLAGRGVPACVATRPEPGRVPLPAGAAFAAGAILCTLGGW